MNTHPPTYTHTHTWYNGETLNTDWIFDDIKKYKLLGFFFFFRNSWLFLETGSLTFSFGDRLSIRDMLSNVNDKMPWGLLQNKCDGRQGNVGWVMRKHDRLWVEKCSWMGAQGCIIFFYFCMFEIVYNRFFKANDVILYLKYFSGFLSVTKILL